MNTNFSKEVTKQRTQPEILPQTDVITRNRFAEAFNEVMTNEYDKEDLGVLANQVLCIFSAASKTLPKQVAARRRLWISESTLKI